MINTLASSVQLDILIYVLLLSVCMGLCFHNKRVKEKLDYKNLQTELITEKLKTLRAQLNPHFLFNALNTAVSLIRLKRDNEAVQALTELSSMLRKILEQKDNDDSKIKDELTFIKNYLAIQKMRFSNKLDFNISVEENCLELAIPNMLLHPLVENAVQHGSQLESDLNPINLYISRTEKQLLVKLTNKVAQHDQHQGFGIGISNTKERLAKLYVDYSLNLSLESDGLFATTLSIPIDISDVQQPYS